MTTSFNLSITAGEKIIGKWNMQEYTIVRVLGKGANGLVYLVKKGKRHYAMKLGRNAFDHQSEINVLKSLDQNGSMADRFLMDADDFQKDGRLVPFYVMRYIKGVGIHQFVLKNGQDWFYLAGKNVLKQLVKLHQKGWVFGDLKSENIIVADYAKVHLIDFGGAAPKGKSIKQFTEIYDRGYWKAGERTADEAYDLFSFAILCLQLLLPRDVRIHHANTILPQNRSVQYLTGLLRSLGQHYDPFQSFIATALSGGYTASSEALAAWDEACVQHRILRRRQKPVVNGLGGIFTASVFVFGATLYLILQ